LYEIKAICHIGDASWQCVCADFGLVSIGGNELKGFNHSVAGFLVIKYVNAGSVPPIRCVKISVNACLGQFVHVRIQAPSEAARITRHNQRCYQRMGKQPPFAKVIAGSKRAAQTQN
jgi:hypothetical protein